MNNEIKFELRRRKPIIPGFWSVTYDTNNGDIRSITVGQKIGNNVIIVPFDRVTGILSGTVDQNDYRVIFNEKIGVLDLVDITHPLLSKKKVPQGWLSEIEGKHNAADIRATLFENTGVLRVEVNRAWVNNRRKRLTSDSLNDKLSIFITDDDPHILFGRVDIMMNDLIERSLSEVRLWSFMEHNIVSAILYNGQSTRINLPPVSGNISFTRRKEYVRYVGKVDDKLVISHSGHGKHITIFLNEGKIMARSHYAVGSPIDHIVGNMQVALLGNDDPDSFVKWVTLPALMIRQPASFEIATEWPYNTPPHVLYNISKLDIGVLP